jgi:hypothetical protein
LTAWNLRGRLKVECLRHVRHRRNAIELKCSPGNARSPYARHHFRAARPRWNRRRPDAPEPRRRPERRPHHRWARRNINGGNPTLRSGTEGVRDRHWEYHTDGVYFVDGKSTLMLRFYRFDTGEMTPVVAFPPRVAIGPRAVTVSPDGKTILYRQEDLTLGDIVLMDNP